MTKKEWRYINDIRKDTYINAIYLYKEYLHLGLKDFMGIISVISIDIIEFNGEMLTISWCDYFKYDAEGKAMFNNKQNRYKLTVHRKYIKSIDYCKHNEHTCKWQRLIEHQP